MSVASVDDINFLARRRGQPENETIRLGLHIEDFRVFGERSGEARRRAGSLGAESHDEPCYKNRESDDDQDTQHDDDRAQHAVACGLFRIDHDV